MTEEISHKTFDLVSVLAGRAYPTIDVPVYFNEALGFELFQLQRKHREAVLTGSDEVDALGKEFRELAAKSESEKYTVTLKGIPEQLRRDIFNKIAEEFPAKKDLIGREEANPAADEAYTKKMWSVYIQTITDPSGAISVPDDAAIDALYGQSPISVHEALNAGVGELQTGAKAGFEAAAKETNFLSDASPEG